MSPCDRVPVHPPLPHVRPVAPLLFLSLLAALCFGCGAGGDEAETMTAETVFLSLLIDPELREVRSEPAEQPVRVDTLKPVRRGDLDGGPMATLVLPPDSEVSFHIPEQAAGSRLDFATGIDEGSYLGGPGDELLFEVRWRGRTVYTESRSLWAETTPLERRWTRSSLELDGAGELVVATRAAEGLDFDPQAGFALLELVRTQEVRRTRASPERPNVVLIVIDTLRADRLHAYGNARETSPAIDALARRGVLFERAFSASSWTWPSTASLMTGTYPPRHGVLGASSCYLPEDLTTLAEAFQRVGLSTAGFSCNPLVAASKNFDQGFELFREYSWDPAERIMDDVFRWLDGFEQHRFFLYLHVIDPHEPYQPADDFRRRFAPDVPDGYRFGETRGMLRRLYEGEATGDEQLREFAANDLNLYDAEIATVDRALGRLFARLERDGLLENTIVALTSDHGEEFLEHGLLGHGGHLYDEAVRVPLVVAGPGLPAGERRGVQVENRRVAATLLHLAGVGPAENDLGSSLLADADEQEREVLTTTRPGRWADLEERSQHMTEFVHGLRLGDYSLLWSPPSEKDSKERTVLFDLARDPEAREDISAARPELTDRLRERVEGWFERESEFRPAAISGGESTREMLRDLGYISDE